MPTFRETIVPILAITVASAILMMLLSPLDATQWAEGFRVGSEVGAEEELGGGIASIIGPLLKITVLMGVPGLITLGVRNLIRRFGAKK